MSEENKTPVPINPGVGTSVQNTECQNIWPLPVAQPPVKPAYKKWTVWANGFAAVAALLGMTVGSVDVKDHPILFVALTALVAGMNAAVHAMPGDSP